MKRMLIGILTLTIISTTFIGCSPPFASKDSDEQVHTDDELSQNIDNDENSDSICEIEVLPEETDIEVELLDDDSNNEEDKEEEKEEKKEVKEAPNKPLPYRIEIDVTNQVVTVYGQDGGGKYTDVVRQMICTTGTSATPTPLGVFKMPGQKGRWGYFTKFKVYAQYWNRIKGGILFHSVLFKEQDVSTISMTSVNNLGRPASHGCVRLTVADAKWIYDNIPAGTEVEVLKKKKNAALTEKLKAEKPAHSVVKLALDSPNSIPIGATEKKEIILNATYDNGKINNVAKEAEWIIADGQIATIQDGILTGLREGATDFTATFSGMKVEGIIAVGPAPAPEPTPEPEPKPQPTLLISPTDITLETGENRDIDLRYNDGKEQVVNDQAKWHTSDDKIAVVDKGNIKGVASGEAEITAEFEGLTAKVRVIVNKQPDELEPEEPKPEEPKPEEPDEPKPEEPQVREISISPAEAINIGIGKEKKLHIKIIMTDDREILNPDNVKWLSSNPDIVSVVGGLIKGVSKGTAQVSVSYNGIEKSVDVTVE